jgi:osmotically-inducible protein OsmY
LIRSVALATVALALAGLGGCVHSDKHSVTIASPSVPPSAAEYLKDGLLVAKVRAQVVAVDLDAASRLGVQVHNGDVVLTGVVRTAAERRRIDKAVRKVGGVNELRDHIRINPHAASLSSGDLALAAHATAALTAQTGVNAANIRVSAEDGVITLTGKVPSASIKTTALDTVRQISGVKGVVDKLHVGH